MDKLCFLKCHYCGSYSPGNETQQCTLGALIEQQDPHFLSVGQEVAFCLWSVMNATRGPELWDASKPHTELRKSCHLQSLSTKQKNRCCSSYYLLRVYYVSSTILSTTVPHYNLMPTPGEQYYFSFFRQENWTERDWVTCSKSNSSQVKELWMNLDSLAPRCWWIELKRQANLMDACHQRNHCHFLIRPHHLPHPPHMHHHSMFL